MRILVNYLVVAHKRLKGLAYRGSTYFCPVCELGSRVFKDFGFPLRENARCPQCGSLERHRFFWLYLTRNRQIIAAPDSRFLHIAPEAEIEAKLSKEVGPGYLTADLYSRTVMEKMDICNIEYDAETFDTIYCSHVLEHVEDDQKAMRELGRVLKNTGKALYMVPIKGQVTDEDPRVTDPAERKIRFGQSDHLRQYGSDFRERLERAGYIVEVVFPRDILSNEELQRYAVSGDLDPLFLCTKVDIQSK